MYGKVSEGQAKTVAAKMLSSGGAGGSGSTHKGDPDVEALHERVAEADEKRDDVVHSVLEGFERTTQKRS